MTDNKLESFEKVMETAYKEAAITAERKIGESIPEPEEKILFSKHHEEKMQAIFKGKYQIPKKPRRIFKKALLIAIICAIGLASTLAVEAWRVDVFNFLFSGSNVSTKYNFKQSIDNTYENNSIKLKYIPEDFKLEFDKSGNFSVYLAFNRNDSYFMLSVDPLTMNFTIDTEGGIKEDVIINKYSATYTSNDNLNTLIWHDEKNAYHLYGNIEKDELIKIAENIVK